MLQVLYAVIFIEMLVIVSFLSKTPTRKLVIVTLDHLKRGRGRVVVKSVATTVAMLLGSSLIIIVKIQNRSLESGTAIDDHTYQVLMSQHMLQASLFGFVLFLSLVIDRLHHYIRELRLLRKAIESARKQIRSFGFGGAVEHKALMEEIGTLKSKIKELEYEYEVKESKVRALEAEVEAHRKQSEEFLMEYDRLLADNENFRSLLQATERRPSRS